MGFSVTDIAQWVSGEIVGDKNLVVSGVNSLEDAGPQEISFLRDAKNSKSFQLFKNSKAGVVLVSKEAESFGKTIIKVANPIAGFSIVLKKIEDEKIGTLPLGVHSQASLHPSVQLGKDVYIGPFCVVEEGVKIGDGSRLIAQVYVGKNSQIGKKTLIYPQVTLREDIFIGNDCILHSGCVIGSDGFGFYFDKTKHQKIPQIGKVIIEDDVEVGAGTTVDRATIGVTRIRKGCKIDNLVQVAHNVDVGELSLLVAQVGIAGSAKLGPGVILGGQAGVGDHITVGAGAKVGGQSGVSQNLEPGAVVFGTPAQPLQDTLRQHIVLKKLPDMYKDWQKKGK